MANCNDKGCPCPPPITIPGLNGVDGTDGINGTDGTNGIDGTNGTNGTDGTNGAVTSLTTTGTSGASTLLGGVLNIPSYATGGFTHYLGEDFDGGIIYHLWKDNLGVEHGLIVNKTEQLTTNWQATGTLTGADRSEDGDFNTNLMTLSDAETYVTSLGAGWYLPSIDELNLLYDNRFNTNKALRAGGDTLLSTTAYYWSSTEYNTTTAFILNFIFGTSANINKSNAYSVRAVRAF